MNDQLSDHARDLFAIRCRDLRDRVVARKISFIDAVDLGYSAAVWAGLVDELGDDVIQGIMAIAFCSAPIEQRPAASSKD